MVKCPFEVQSVCNKTCQYAESDDGVYICGLEENIKWEKIKDK